MDHLAHLWGLIGSRTHLPEPQRFRERLLATVKRAWHPAGTARQLLAVIADGDRSDLLGRISCPTTIVHGEQDPLIPVAAAHDLAAKIRGAELDVIDGMGHDLPLALLPRLAADIACVVQRARAQRRGLTQGVHTRPGRYGAAPAGYCFAPSVSRRPRDTA